MVTLIVAWKSAAVASSALHNIRTNSVGCSMLGRSTLRPYRIKSNVRVIVCGLACCLLIAKVRHASWQGTCVSPADGQ